MLPVTLAPCANAEMKPNQQTGPHGERAFPRFRKQPGDVVAVGRQPHHDLNEFLLHPVDRANHRSPFVPSSFAATGATGKDRFPQAIRP